MIVTSVSVRAAQLTDLPALTDLYNHYVVTSPATFDLEPFTVEQRRGWFDHYTDTGRHRLLVATVDDAIVGYATSSRFRDKAAYRTSVESTVYCSPTAVGRGVGSALYRELFDALRTEDVHRAYAGIALPNDASIALHERFGFTPVGTFHEVGRKFDTWWDVLWLERPVG